MLGSTSAPIDTPMIAWPTVDDQLGIASVGHTASRPGIGRCVNPTA